MVSFFVKFVRICFTLCEGFIVGTIENKLVPTNSEGTEYHLMNLAFKQHVHKVLENKEIREMLVDLVKNENCTFDEMKFLENYPILRNACINKMLQSFMTRMNHFFTAIRDSLAENLNEDVPRTFTYFDDFETYDSEDSIPSTESRQMRADRITRGIEFDTRSEREEAILGRPLPKPSQKLKKRAPITFPKSSSKSYYNYSNPKKYNKSDQQVVKLEVLVFKNRLGRAKILRILIFYLKKQQNPASKFDESTMTIVPDRKQEQLSDSLQTLNSHTCSQPLVTSDDSTQIVSSPSKNPLNSPLGAFTAIPNLLNSFDFPTNSIFQSNTLTQTLLTQAQITLQPFLISLLRKISPQPPILPFHTMIPLMNPGLVPPLPNSFVFAETLLFPNAAVSNPPF
ncbi:unnamed protein product [Caenorhabditis brenneri]